MRLRDKKIPTLDRDCAAKEIRTPTPFQALPPQGSASTNFAIAAVIFNSFILIKEIKDNLIGLKFEIILIKPAPFITIPTAKSGLNPEVGEGVTFSKRF